jgi:hypothetical protein
MNKLDLATLGVEEMSDAQMMEVDGGGWLDVAADFAIDFFIWAAKETHNRGTLMDMDQRQAFAW